MRRLGRFDVLVEEAVCLGDSEDERVVRELRDSLRELYVSMEWPAGGLDVCLLVRAADLTGTDSGSEEEGEAGAEAEAETEAALREKAVRVIRAVTRLRRPQQQEQE